MRTLRWMLPFVVVLSMFPGVSLAGAASTTVTPTVTVPVTSTAIDTTGGTTGTTTTPGSTGTNTTSTTGTGSSGGRDDRSLAGLALLFGLIAVGAVLYFVRNDRKNTLATYATLIESGAAVQAGDVPPQGALPAGQAAVEELTPQVTIDGPDMVVVGVPADFVAKQGGTQVVATWTADPAAATAPLGDPSSRVTITAKQAGSFSLTAAVAGSGSVPKRVAAAPADRARQTLPFIGAGWGSVVVAIIIAALTGALGLAGALTGEGVATILGALVGYVVAKGQTETRPGSSTDGSASGSGSATGASHGS